MAEKITPGPVSGNACIREAVCIHTNKVYDSCKSKECIRDLRVYLTADSQEFIDHGAISAKARQAELLCVCIDVEKVPFKDVRLCFYIGAGVDGRRGNTCKDRSLGAFGRVRRVFLYTILTITDFSSRFCSCAFSASP